MILASRSSTSPHLAIMQALASLSALSNIVLGLPEVLIEYSTKAAVLDALQIIAEDLIDDVTP
jgi:hypothetical protein